MIKDNIKRIIAVTLAVFATTAATGVKASASWKYDNTGWWYSEDNGYDRGWKYLDNSWYYFDEQGYMKIGWFLDGDTWYYLNSNGDMKTGWLQEGDKWYYLSSSGAMLKDTSVEGYILGSDGAMVEKSDINNQIQDNDSIQGTESLYKDADITTDKISMAAERGESPYNIDTRNLTIYITNNSNEELEYGQIYEIDKLENGKWYRLDFKEGTNNNINIGHKIEYKHTHRECCIPYTLKDFDNLTAGTYRVVQSFKSSSGETIYAAAKFNLNAQKFLDEIDPATAQEVVITPEAASNVYDLGTDDIDVYITNTTVKENGYGTYYKVYKFENNKWNPLEFADDVGFNEIEICLMPRDTNNEGYSLSALKDFDNLTAGKYKIVTDIKIDSSEEYASFEFELK